MKFGCKIHKYIWNYLTHQLGDDFFGRKKNQKTPTVSGSSLLSCYIPSLLQWQSATSMERKECCFPHLFKHKHNGLLMLGVSAFLGKCCDHLAVFNEQCGSFSGSPFFIFCCFNQA